MPFFLIVKLCYQHSFFRFRSFFVIFFFRRYSLWICLLNTFQFNKVVYFFFLNTTEYFWVFGYFLCFFSHVDNLYSIILFYLSSCLMLLSVLSIPTYSSNFSFLALLCCFLNWYGTCQLGFLFRYEYIIISVFQNWLVIFKSSFIYLNYHREFFFHFRLGIDISTLSILWPLVIWHSHYLTLNIPPCYLTTYRIILPSAKLFLFLWRFFLWVIVGEVTVPFRY